MNPQRSPRDVVKEFPQREPKMKERNEERKTIQEKWGKSLKENQAKYHHICN